MQMKTPQISTANAGTGGKDDGITVFELVVLGLLEFFGTEWASMQIRESAELLFSEYYWLHIAELKHCITKIKTGELRLSDGKKFRPYGKFSPIDLMECFSAYADESMKHRAQIGEMKANEERFDERWNTHDERKDKSAKEQSLRGMVAQVKGDAQKSQK